MISPVPWPLIKVGDEKFYRMYCRTKKKCIFAASKVRGVAQLASALAWGARGRKFESSYPDDCKRTIEKWFSFFTLSIITLKKTRC